MRKMILLLAALLCAGQLFAAGKIVIGANMELTGPIASLGQGTKEGILLAAEQQNKKGGLLGKQIDIIVLDNKSDATEAANQTVKLIAEHRVCTVLGPVTSGNCKAAAPIAQRMNVLLFTPTATNPDVTKIGNNIFRACFLDSYQGQAIAQFAAKTLKAKKMAVLMENGNDYARGLGDFAGNTFKKLGGQVVAREFYAKSEKDFSSLLTKIKAKKPDVIVLPSYYDTVALCIKQAREMGITAAMLGGDGWDSPQLTKIAGAKNLNNAFFTNHYSPLDKSPIVQNFVKAYQAKYKKTPDALAALGYDTALMLFDAINRAKSDKSDKIRDALAVTKNFQGVSGTISMGKDRNPIKSISILALVNGKQVLKQKIMPGGK